MTIYIIVIIIVLSILGFIYFYINQNQNQIQNTIFNDTLYTDFTYFYNTQNENFKFLEDINKFSTTIYNETMTINSNWSDWPETNLYNKNNGDSWKIFPFYGFGVWVDKNCERCPTLYNFIKTIPNLKLATLSKLSSQTKLKPHKGWGSHSNFVIRCHYGISVPEKCYISVCNSEKPPLHENRNNSIISKSYPNNYIYKDLNGNREEIQFHKQFKWTIFDDSETHYAGNLSNTDRIVLIIDIMRPKTIKNGSTTGGDTSELLQIIDYYKNHYK